MYILDTDHWTVLQLREGREFDHLVGNMLRHADSDYFVTIVTFQEVMNGWLKFLNNARLASGVVRAYERLEFLIGQFAAARLLPFGESAAHVFDELRSSKIRVSTLDLRIASIAVSNQMTVLTRNTVDFGRVPGLSMLDCDDRCQALFRYPFFKKKCWIASGSGSELPPYR